VDDQRRGAVRDAALDVALEVPPLDVQRARDRPLLVLVGLAHVEHDGARLLARLVRGRRVDLTDLTLRRRQQVPERRHTE
jgi:hypothetical protein